MATKKITKTGVGFLIDASAKTYETLEKQLREFISNSLDANATDVLIEVFNYDKKIVITDNGNGMTEEEFDNNYLVIGCSQKYGDKSTIGRIGVGKFSSIPLSDSLTIRTKKAGQKNVYQATLDLSKLKDPKNRTKDISKLELGEGEYVDKSIDDPDDKFMQNGSFSKIVMSGVADEIIKQFDDPVAFNNLCRNLGAILPLEYSPNSEAMKKLKKQGIELYNKTIKNSETTKLNIIIKTQKIPKGIKLYRQLFGDDFETTGEQIAGELFLLISPPEMEPIKIFGYLADMTFGKKEYAKWKGINSRVQNTTVVENCFFEHNDPPADARITGEMHILGANEEELITMNRAGFIKSYEQYKDVSEWITQRLNDFASTIIRRRTQFNSLIKKYQNKLKNQQIVSESIEKTVLHGFNDIDIDMEQLKKNELKEEDEIDEIKEIKQEFDDLICEVIQVPDSTMKNIHTTIVGDKYSITVPEKLIEYEAEIKGVVYKIKYVEHDKDEPVIDVDTQNNIIRVNRNSTAIKHGSHSMVMSYILLELAFIAYENDPKELKANIFKLLKLAFS